jgi:hypothetical protein
MAANLPLSALAELLDRSALALAKIALLLDEQEWDADTASAIADIVRAEGYIVRDVGDRE